MGMVANLRSLAIPAIFSVFIHSGDALPSEALTPRQAPKCIDFEIPVTASANNKLIYSPTHDLSTVDGVTSFLSSDFGLLGQLFNEIPQTITVPLSARYCAPDPNAKAPPSRKSHVQFLVHGIPYTKNYWQGLFYPGGAAPYDWVAQATSRGYPVLSVDNLGNGNSSTHPDPILQVQQPLETEVYHQLIKKLRAGTIGHGVPKAEKVIFVGHSYASVLGNAILTKYPTDVDAAILTGYSYTIANAVPGVLLAGLVPASVYSPAKYGHLDPGYLTFDLEQGKRESYYAADGTFDPALAHFDYENQGVTSIGEIATFFAGLQKATHFKGDVLAITGRQDALFCGLGSRKLGKPNCGNQASGVVERSGQFFPNANYKFYLPEGTSHATNLHRSSQSIFKQAHAFLSGTGY